MTSRFWIGHMILKATRITPADQLLSIAVIVATTANHGSIIVVGRGILYQTLKKNEQSQQSNRGNQSTENPGWVVSGIWVLADRFSGDTREPFPG